MMKMRRLTVLLTLFAVIAGGVAIILSVEQRVKESNRDLTRLYRGIADHKQQLHMLRAEWRYLNHPDRVRELSERYLDLQPPHAMQVSSNFFTAPTSPANGNNGLSAGSSIASVRY